MSLDTVAILAGVLTLATWSFLYKENPIFRFTEHLFVGMSSGAAVAGALRYAATLDKGTIVVLLPDRGDRYLSTALFRSICAQCPP